jgi:hypothetical protein
MSASTSSQFSTATWTVVRRNPNRARPAGNALDCAARFQLTEQLVNGAGGRHCQRRAQFRDTGHGPRPFEMRPDRFEAHCLRWGEAESALAVGDHRFVPCMFYNLYTNKDMCQPK